MNVQARFVRCGLCHAPMLIVNGHVDPRDDIVWLYLGPRPGEPIGTVTPHLKGCRDLPDPDTVASFTPSTAEILTCF